MSKTRSRAIPIAGVTLFTVAIFCAAFLIFAVQPMVGKRILPWFGGVPSVWTLCLAFYQSTLLLGYAYAHGLAVWVRPALQPWIHAALLGASLWMLPVLPGDVWKPEGAGDASGLILSMLTANVALPFALLAATGPLVQAWFARAFPGRSPYPLYAVSNLGSLLALLAYPTLIEPRMPVLSQSDTWSWAFAATGLLVLGCALWAIRMSRGGDVAPGAEATAGPAGEARPRDARILWVLFPAAAVALFMGVTNLLCLDVASVPFLWVVPLSIYLATLILAFGWERLYRRGPFLLLASLCLALLAGERFAPLAGPWLAWSTSMGPQIVLYSVALFLGCMIAHGELYRLRPAPQHLTAFYLAVAGGGALGGLFVAIAAPRLFDGYHELPIAVGVIGLSLLAAWRLVPSEVTPGQRRAAAGAAVLAFTALVFYALPSEKAGVETRYLQRNFFGILRILELSEPGTLRPMFMLRNGTTRHGLQYRNAKLRRQPSSYFGRSTGVGLALAERSDAEPLHVGVVGLGVGTLAAYGREGDRIVFYEIDPDVARIARDTEYFTYLRDSAADVEIVLGDARLSLESELAGGRAREFDVLVLDAFSSDAIPVHLLTREAFQVYGRHLKDDGLLAVHVSSRHVDLVPLVARQGAVAGLDALLVENLGIPRHWSQRSTWVILSRDPAALQALESRARDRAAGLRPGRITTSRPRTNLVEQAPLWTDDYSDLFRQLRFFN